MKNTRNVIAIMVMVLMLFSACAGKPAQPNAGTTAATVEPTTNATVSTTAPPAAPVQLSEEEKFETLIKDNFWHMRALGCTFEKPEDISAWFYFYLGIGELGHNDYKFFTSEEIAFLGEAYKNKYGREEYTMATRLPVEKINEGLSILGVTLENIEIPKDWVYYDKTDAYYFWVSDAYGVTNWKVTEVETGTNGIIKVCWESEDMLWNTTDETAYPDGTKMVMTLQEDADGTYLVLSNVPQK